MTEAKLVPPKSFLDAIDYCARQGDTIRIRQFLEQPFHGDFVTVGQKAALAKACAFLQAVEQVEAVQGKYCMLDLEHPRIKEGIEQGLIHDIVIGRSRAYCAGGNITAEQLWLSGSRTIAPPKIAGSRDG